MIEILNFYVGTLDSLKHLLCMSQGCRSLPQLFERKIISNCIRPWLECWHRHLNIRIKEPATKPAKKFGKFSKVGKRIHRSSGIRTRTHCSTSPGPSPLSHSARHCWLPFFAKFIHLASLILTPNASVHAQVH